MGLRSRSVSGEAAPGGAGLVDLPKGDLKGKRSDSAKSTCEFKARAHARHKARAKSAALAKIKEQAEPAPQVEVDAWGFPLVLETKDSSRQRIRKQKFAAQSALFGLKPTAANGKVKSRSFAVCICGKFSRNDCGGDLILDADVSNKTAVRNAQFCGSQWVCPDCRQHVGITQGSWVERALAALRDAGDRVVMVTLTVPHNVEESCGVVFDRLMRAMAKLDAHGSYRNLRTETGHIGDIRVKEITYTDNGWHVHYHGFHVFSGQGVETTAAEDQAWAQQLQASIYPLWNKIIFGLTGKQASKTHGITVVPVWSNNDYIAKLPEQAKAREESNKPRWGPQAELTKGHVKKAEKGGRTPWDILDGVYKGDETDIELFRDYAQGTWNRTQFEVTRGLRDRLSSLDVAPLGSDLEIVREDPDFVFVDEVEENTGDQSKIVIDRMLVDRDSQADAHCEDPMWLESVRLDVELGVQRHDAQSEAEVETDLPNAMRNRGFILELISKEHFVPSRLRQGLERSAYFDRDLCIEPGHFEPNLWRATWLPSICCRISPVMISQDEFHSAEILEPRALNHLVTA